MYRICALATLIFLSILSKTLAGRNQSVPLSKLATCREFVTGAIDCEHFFPIESIKNYQSQNYKLYMKFYAFAYWDADFVLTNKKDQVDCRIIIGGWENTRSTLNCNGKDLYESNIKNTIEPMWPTEIIISQTTCGWLEVSLPGVAEPLLAGNVTNLDLEYICLYSFGGKKSRWFYNCVEEEDKQHKPPSKKCPIV